MTSVNSLSEACEPVALWRAASDHHEKQVIDPVTRLDEAQEPQSSGRRGPFEA